MLNAEIEIGQYPKLDIAQLGLLQAFTTDCGNQ